jgi:hypothetical protein
MSLLNAGSLRSIFVVLFPFLQIGVLFFTLNALEEFYTGGKVFQKENQTIEEG